MKKFVLLRGRDSGSLYLYDRATYKFMLRYDTDSYGLILEFVLDSDDREVLEGFQKLVNKDIQVED